MPKLALPPACLRVLSSRSAVGRAFTSSPSRKLAQARHGILNQPSLPQPAVTPLSATYFSPDRVRRLLEGLDNPKQDGHKPPNERVLKLGKTLRILSPLIPTMFYAGVPKEILSENVTIHLFPSSHPHLPTLTGGAHMYHSGLWITPLAWGSIPFVGNVRLEVLSERIVRAGAILDPDHAEQHDCGDERLVIRFETRPRSSSNPFFESQSNSKDHSYSAEEISRSQTHEHSALSPSEGTFIKTLRSLLRGKEPLFSLSKEDQFTGLLIFSFDEEGRISTLTIEQSSRADGWDRTSKFVTLADWLIGKARGTLDRAPNPGLAIDSCGEYGLPASNTRYPRRS